MSEEQCIVIGGSHAGAQVCLSLRQGGWQGGIIMISDEGNLPYHRPPLSKAYLAGDAEIESLYIRPEALYEKNRIDVRLNSLAVKIDRQEKSVQLSDGEVLTYSKLVLATGARARYLPAPGAHLEGVCYLRSLEDVNKIRASMKEGGSAAIVGGGYIGLEAAASFRKLGLSVTVVEAMPRILQRVASEEISEFYQRTHTEEGVDILTDCGLKEIFGEKGRVTSVELSNGSRIDADLVVVGIGILPNVELAEEIGLEVDNGIVVNDFAQTSDESIYAVGDCANHYNKIYDRKLRLESVQNATDQAKVAAAAINGKAVAYNALPWFWSDQYDVKLQIAGLADGYDQVVLRGGINTRSFAVFYLKDNIVLSVTAVNRPMEFMLARKYIPDMKPIDTALLADESVAIKEVFEPEP